MRIPKTHWIKKREKKVTLTSSEATPRGNINFKEDSTALRIYLPNYKTAIDLTLTNCKITYAYLGDTLIITEGPIEAHKITLEIVVRRPGEENLALSLDKYKFAWKEIEWLGFPIDSGGTTH